MMLRASLWFLLHGLAAAAPGPAPRPRLVVVITVDQLRREYLDRYRAQLQGGLGLLLREGADFVAAYQDHAVTETAPGHATILSGRWPAHTGIIRNAAGVSDSSAPLLEVAGPGASPLRFRGAGRRWELLLPPRAYPEPDSVAAENGGTDIAFPHRLPADSARAAAAFVGVPGMDSLTLAFALEGVRAMHLGGGRATDLLAVSLSTTDAIGHAFGPDSREIHDQVLRLDRYLGTFFAQLFVRYGRDRLLIVLTADHGVTPLVERSRALGHADAVRVAPDTLIASVNAALDRRVGGGEWLVFDTGMLLFPDRAGLAARGVDVDSLIAAVAARLRTLPGVARVDRPADLAARDTADPLVRRWRHQVPPDAGVELVVTLRPYSVWSYPGVAIPAMHGQPTDLDAHVPLLLWGRGVRRGTYRQRVSTVDIAPTLARLLGLTPAEPLDGRVLAEALDPHP